MKKNGTKKEGGRGKVKKLLTEKRDRRLSRKCVKKKSNFS
jgi:hypothetical protein